MVVAPAEFALTRPSPNPFSSAAVIRLSLVTGCHAGVRVYNVAGELVRTIQDGPMQAGVHNIVWDGRDDRRHKLPSGTYTVTAVAEGVEQSHRVVLAR